MLNQSLTETSKGEHSEPPCSSQGLCSNLICLSPVIKAVRALACISYKLYISGSELQSIPAHEWEMIVTLTTSITGLKQTTTLPLCCACATIGAYGWLCNFALGLTQMPLSF